MASPQAPTVTQFGFTTALGNIANICDGDDATFWAPYADNLATYVVPPVSDAGVLLPGNPFPALQFDFGVAARIPIFRVRTEGPKSIGDAYLICSPNPATSVNDTVQSSDTYAGRFTITQMNSGAALTTLAATQPIRGRYWRFVFFKQPPAS